MANILSRRQKQYGNPFTNKEKRGRPRTLAYLLVAALALLEGNLEIVPIHQSWDKQAWPSSVDGSGFGYDDGVGAAPLTCSAGIWEKNCPYTIC